MPPKTILRPTELNAFENMLKELPEAYAIWRTTMRPALVTLRKRTRGQTDSPGNDAGIASQADLQAAIKHAIYGAAGAITPAKIQEIVDKVVDRGDIAALRIVCKLAGLDMVEEPATQPEGARVILIEPFDSEYELARRTIDEATRLRAGLPTPSC